MTKIKLCGLKRPCDIVYVNELAPDYVGFVFVKNSKRYVTPEDAEKLRKQLQRGIIPVGVFVDEEPDVIVDLLERHIVEAVQLHGSEDENYIRTLQKRVGCSVTVIKAFCLKNAEDVGAIEESPADYVLLDSGGGTGKTFDWSLLSKINRPYFLAGGLTPENVKEAIVAHHPFGVDASSSLETEGLKDKRKMAAFVRTVRQGKDS